MQKNPGQTRVFEIFKCIYPKAGNPDSRTFGWLRGGREFHPAPSTAGYENRTRLSCLPGSKILIEVKNF